MKYLNQKLIREVKQNWTQFFSVFLMALLSIIVFVGLQGSWKGLEASLNHYISDTHLANYWVQSSSISDTDVRRVKNLSGITNAQSGTRIQTKQGKHHLIIDSYKKPVTKLHVVTGKKYQSTQNGIWINQEYAQAHHLKVGNDLQISYLSRHFSLKIRGIVQSSERIYFTGTREFIAPNYSNYGYAYISPQTLAQQVNYHGPQNVLTIKGYHPQMRHQVEKILQQRLMSYDNRSTLPDVSNAMDRVDEIKNLSYLFSFIFILLAILAMYTTIKRLIESQGQEIATLKALGFSNAKIMIHYASFGLLVGSLGSLVGLLIAPFISWFVLRTQKQMFSIHQWTLAYGWSSLFVVLLVTLICVLAAFLAARSATKGLPAVFLQGTKTTKVHKIILEKWTGLWNHLSYTGRWAFRDIFINRTRTLMGIIGVAGSTMLMIAGIGMPQSMTHLVNKAYNQDFTYNQRLYVNNYQQYQQAHPHAQQWVQISQAHFSPDDGFNRLLIVVGKGHEVHMKTQNNQSIKDGGLYVTHGFAQSAHIKKGDRLKVRTFGSNQQYQFKVRGILLSETNQGAYLTKHTWEQAGGLSAPTTLLVGPNYHYHKRDVSSTISIKEQKKNAYNFVNNLMSIFLLIIVFGVLLIVIVLYNLGSLSFVERLQDYATLRVLGIHKPELRNLVFIENVITTFVGWLFGIPAGIWFLGQYVKTFSTINLEYTPYINVWTIVISSAFVWLCSLSTTFFVSQRLKKVDMVQALKGSE
ncbi:FtsX-like permease family protein [Bombilactobacillus folatiphilus]|uniref:FtsX-like permease family protein n=1 Tax=Bombilactobacillus folatiphilus TaxID=2923362 RepID=A0ABY4P8L8_9LACO|nr:FtsX-like permease family protein [Bombilactobacillus folatiphilus]UQS81992.1 FtsX-like permease family protein [Bombilactobacillus folatiphilus]